VNKKRDPGWVVVACLIAILAAPSRASGAPKWIQLRSANFVLEGDVDERSLRDVAQRLEEFRETLSRMMPNARFDRTPTVVLVFPNPRAYEPFMPRYEGRRVDVAGYFQLGQDVNYVSIVLGRENPFPTVFHEFAHLFTHSNFVTAPLWFDEGMAEYYESFTVSGNGKHATVGTPIGRNLELLRDRWLPLKDLLEADRAAALYNSSRDRDVFYAESWALTHCLLAGGAARTKQLLAFLGRVTAGTPCEQACQEAFGLSVADLERELRQYVQRFEFNGIIVTFTESITSRVSSRPQQLTEAAAEARVGDLLAHMSRMDEAETHLQKALRLDPDQVLAHLSLGELRLRQNKEAEGLKYLERATALDPNSFEAHTAYGLAVMRRTSLLAPAERNAAGRKAYTRALEIRPESPEAMGGLAWALFLSGERLDEAQRLAERAATADPLEPDYPLLLAQVHASRREFAAARNLLGPLMASPRADIRERARATSARVVEYERAVTAAQSRGGTPNRLVPTDSRSRVIDTAPSYTLLLRALQAGEQRVFGSLERIECTAGAIFFYVKSGERTLRFSAAKFDGVEFITYRDDLKGNVGCGARTPADPVYATFRPAAAGAAAKSDGEIVAVEFVPRDYSPK
jgi:tetratricopeptide (TPR) repeat protein